MEGNKENINSGLETIEYGPDVHELLNNLEFPADASYTLNCSPAYHTSLNPSSSNTPVLATPVKLIEIFRMEWKPIKAIIQARMELQNALQSKTIWQAQIRT